MKIRTPEYMAWQNMRKRYDFAEAWNNFKTFFKHVGNKPSNKHILQRIDRTLPYSKENFHWGTKKNNYTVKINYNGKQVWAADLCDQLGVKNKNQFVQRIRRGWDVEDAVDEKPRRIIFREPKCKVAGALKKAVEKKPFVRKSFFKKQIETIASRPSHFPPGYGFAAYSPLYQKSRAA